MNIDIDTLLVILHSSIIFILCIIWLLACLRIMYEDYISCLHFLHTPTTTIIATFNTQLLRLFVSKIFLHTSHQVQLLSEHFIHMTVITAIWTCCTDIRFNYYLNISYTHQVQLLSEHILRAPGTTVIWTFPTHIRYNCYLNISYAHQVKLLSEHILRTPGTTVIWTFPTHIR